MIKNIKLFAVGIVCLSAVTAFAQDDNSLRLDSCYAKARRNYPLVKQYALIEKSTDYSIDNANRANITQFNINGQATYQSDVTALPIALPGVNIEPLSKDQYRLYGELSQPLTNLIITGDQKDLIRANAAIEGQRVEVELYKIKERINNLFFGILLIDGQIDQVQLMMKDIQSGIDRTNIAIENGIALQSSADNLKAELLKANQRIIELKANRKAYVSMLSRFIGISLDETTVLLRPELPVLSTSINRAELNLFDLQKKSLDIQSKMISNKTLPYVNLFVQGGLGRPALNMLDNTLKGYYIGGVRLNWNISNFYTNGKERKILGINQTGLDVQKDVFLFNTNLALEQQNAETNKIESLIESDSEIIDLRKSIKNTTQVQLENGMITTNDYLVAVNAQDQAQQNLILHEIQLLMAQYNLQTTTGN